MRIRDAHVLGHVLRALGEEDALQRRVAIRGLRNQDRGATLDALVAALDSDDESVRVSAASVLPVFGAPPEIGRELIRHLRHNPSAAVRIACARELARVDWPAATKSLFAALNDDDDGVAQVACAYLARRGGRDSIDALFPLLSHPSWDVRLRACVSLMDLNVRGSGIVQTMEALARDPRAAKHDADVAASGEIVELRGAVSRDEDRIGAMRMLLHRARSIAPENARLAA